MTPAALPKIPSNIAKFHQKIVKFQSKILPRHLAELSDRSDLPLDIHQLGHLFPCPQQYCWLARVEECNPDAEQYRGGLHTPRPPPPPRRQHVVARGHTP